MQLVVLNYEYGTVEYVRNVPEDINDLNSFVCDILGYKDSYINWMTIDDNNKPLLYTYDAKVKKMFYDNDNFLSYDS